MLPRHGNHRLCFESDNGVPHDEGNPFRYLTQRLPRCLAALSQATKKSHASYEDSLHAFAKDLLFHGKTARTPVVWRPGFLCCPVNACRFSLSLLDEGCRAPVKSVDDEIDAVRHWAFTFAIASRRYEAIDGAARESTREECAAKEDTRRRIDRSGNRRRAGGFAEFQIFPVVGTLLFAPRLPIKHRGSG